MTYRRSYPVRWREYQDNLRQTERRQRVRKRLYLGAAVATLAAAGLVLLMLAGPPRAPRQHARFIRPCGPVGR